MKDDCQIMEQAGEIFCNALEIDSLCDRDEYVIQACAGNDALHKAVLELLGAHSGAEELFKPGCPTRISAEELTQSLSDDPSFREAVRAIAPRERELGQCIGPYRLIRKIGEGGGGNVYLAEQEQPVRRQVALKVLRLGTDTKRVIERFEAERQVLAIMEHPNIAHVLDAGATDEGLPYFVMELVHGVKITDYCDENGLDIQQREELFLQVCHAIQHAHQKGIIHRDIKPSNILITLHDGHPVPKVIDFGVAKAMVSEPKDDQGGETVCEPFVGTPVYMSPEQAGGGRVDVDMRSDIYSLGVLFYELLVGKPPFDHRGLLQNGLDEMLRTLREREPLRPSAKLMQLSEEDRAKTTRCRQIDLRRLNSLLSGDLDWIAMKAMEKNRDRRYQTVDGLAEDVLHHLHHEPIKARPPSRLYRLRKLAQRNKGVFASILAVGLTLSAGFGMSSWLFIKERAALKEVERARQNEAVLREEAEIRERITQAAVLLRQEKPDDADELVGNCRIPVIKPSLEAADVFRRLGVWNVSQGRWESALDRFLKLLKANKVDKNDMSDDATRDLLTTAPLLVALGDMERYHSLVGDALARFKDSKNPVAAEQVIKISIIIPLNEAAKETLAPLAGVVAASISDPSGLSEYEEYLMAWRVFALAGLEYRMGNYEKAVTWGIKSLDGPSKPVTRGIMTRLFLAMAYHRLGQTDMAQTILELGRSEFERNLPTGWRAIRSHGNNFSGLWHDWVMASLLLDEAGNLVLETPPLAE